MPPLARVAAIVAVGVLSLASAARLEAQLVRGHVVQPDGTPVAGVIVVATDARGATAGRALTNERGHFVLPLPAGGRFELKLLRIGYRPTRGALIDVVGNATETVQLTFAAEAVVLSTVSVNARETCRVNADTGLLVTRAWEEARKAMLSTELSADGAPLFAEWIEYERTLDSAARIVRDQRVRTSRNPTTHAFRSEPAEVLSTKGYVVAAGGVTTFHVPDAEVLLSEIFASGHCFRLEDPPPGRENLVGVAFQPTRERREMREIEGTLWLDRATAELRTLEFRYTNLPPAARSADAGGAVEFLRLDDGNWLVSRWHLRMPQLATETPMFSGLKRIVVSGKRVVLRGVKVAGGEVTSIARGDSVLYQLLGSEILVQVVGGDAVVRPLRARLTLDGTDYSASADDSGLIVLAPVLPGRYRGRLRTAMMDSLAMPPVVFDLEASTQARVDTVTLPVARTFAEVSVSDIDGQPLPYVSLEARSANGVERSAVTGLNGRALIRDLTPGTLTVSARRLGFPPGRIDASIGPGRNALAIVMSQSSAPMLDTVRVAGNAQTVARLREFEMRRINRQATVSITREDILRRNPTDAWQMLTNVPSVRIVDIDTMVIARSTRTTIANYQSDYCYPLVMVDGVLLNRDTFHKAFDLRFLPRPDEIHGIEVFAGAASLPVQYGGMGDGKWCGVIAIWTR